MSGMGHAAEQERAHSEVDHGIGHVEAAFVVAHQPAPPHHPAECSLDHPAPRQHLEAFLVWQLAHDLKREVLVCRKACQLAAVVGAIGEQVLEPRPALADGGDDPGRVPGRGVGGRAEPSA